MNNRVLETGLVLFFGREREYNVVSRDLSPSPKYFISHGGGKPFISDEVPGEYREFMVFHELMEYEKLPESAERCLNALKKELEKVPTKMKNEYIKFRFEVFKNLISYLETHEPKSKFIPKAKKSLEYLAGHQ